MEEGRKVPDPRRIRWLIAGFLIVLFSGLVTLLVGTSPPQGDFFSQILDIPRGMNGEDIADLLHRNGLLRNKFFFKVILGIRGGKPQAGEYELNNRMSLRQILKILEEGKVRLHRFTIPEGFTLEEIAKLLAKQKLANSRKFLKLTRDKKLVSRYTDEKKATLEGYLFPDTYKVPKGMKEKALIEMMLQRFEEIRKELREKLGKEEMSRGALQRTVILASLIEKEAATDEEKRLISGVFKKRLDKKMLLQSDPTVKYVLPKSRKNLYYKDLEIDSPYNTYLHKGLPPGPICNPGRLSLEAALLPLQTDYLYFVSRNDGTHQFSRTYEEHLAAKMRYQK